MDESSRKALRVASSVYDVFSKHRDSNTDDCQYNLAAFMTNYVSGLQSLPEMLHLYQYTRFAEANENKYRILKAALVHSFTKNLSALVGEYASKYKNTGDASFNDSLSYSFEIEWREVLAKIEFYMGRYVRFVKDTIDGLATSVMVEQKRNADLIVSIMGKKRLLDARIAVASHMICLYFCNAIAHNMNKAAGMESLMVDIGDKTITEIAKTSFLIPDIKKRSYVWKQKNGKRSGLIPPSRFMGKEVIIPYATKKSNQIK